MLRLCLKSIFEKKSKIFQKKPKLSIKTKSYPQAKNTQKA